ncbi:hypothetical protein BC628DRAFT_1406562 [Trametes gibbosa]|nr:hypothetical protein BC628DRAFT_1334845 [Trametes gibbosa]KAI0833557.1 hypothetical protein BC628DRAFT_1406562 [Trametes gibbosa]
MFSDKLTILLLLFASALGLVHVVLWSAQSSRVLHVSKPSPRNYSYKAHDRPELFPLPQEPAVVYQVLEESVHYLPLGEASDAQWLSLGRPGFGYVRLGPDDRTFVVSMYHELHCLRMINLAFSPGAVSLAHVKHCFNYLRQNILCTPDLALEWGDFETKDFDVERTHGVHECKDWAQIYSAVTDNYEAWQGRTK